MTLSPKQQRFCQEYLVDLNASDAARRAGYSAKTAGQKGHELANKNPDTMAEIARLQQERAERTKIDSDWVLTRLAAEADADIADLYTPDGTLRPVHEWPEVWRKGLVAGLDVEEIREEGAVVGMVRKLKLSDRIKRIELIGKHVNVQAFREQVGVGNPDGTQLGPTVIEIVAATIGPESET